MGFDDGYDAVAEGAPKFVEIFAYCLMPTHFHILLRQVRENGISIYLNNVLNGYSRYFNRAHRRKGPLWVGRFGRRLVQTDEDFLGMTRYIHLNPATAGLVEKPEQWIYSSYKEYLNPKESENSLCDKSTVIDMDPAAYKNFVNDHAGYQKDLAKIKGMMME
jgi:putative transposase